MMKVSDAHKPTAQTSIEGLSEFTHEYATVNGTEIHYVIGDWGPLSFCCTVGRTPGGYGAK